MGNCFGQCFLNNKSSSCSGSSQSDQQNLFEDEPTFQQNNNLIFRILKTKPKNQSRFLNRFWTKKEQLYAKLGRSKCNVPNSNIHLQCLDARSLMMMARDGDFAYKQDLHSECTSMHSNSLDLEWEHEYHTNIEQWLPHKSCDDLSDNDGTVSNDSELSNKSTKNRRNLITRVDHNLKVHLGGNNSLIVDGSSNVSYHSGLSHRSTPDSLEWDQHQDHLKSDVDSLDFETKELLNEIELLKNRVLSETGSGLCVAEHDER